MTILDDKIHIFARIKKEDPGFRVYIIESASAAEERIMLSSPVPINRMTLEKVLESFGFHIKDIYNALEINEGEYKDIKHPLW
ncbi:MAG: hypothetical protein AAGB35_09475, partial [Pseudomonadota bacterium]